MKVVVKSYLKTAFGLIHPGEYSGDGIHDEILAAKNGLKSKAVDVIFESLLFRKFDRPKQTLWVPLNTEEPVYTAPPVFTGRWAAKKKEILLRKFS